MRNKIYIIAFFVIVMFVMSVVCSCSGTRHVTVERIKNESAYVEKLKRDSIYQRDSIYMLVKGDTVFKYQYKYLYRDKQVSDTVSVIKFDSIPYTVEVPRYIDKKLSWWQSALILTGGIAWVVAILGLMYLTNKRFNWLSLILKLIKL